MEKLEGFEFWRKTLNQAHLVVAPMVDQSELAWRLLSRRHGAQLCYTPMLHASVFIRDAHYRRENLVTCPEDKPLIVQFCANDPEIFVKAAKLAEPFCDAIDLNLGCPQSIAKRGHYGAFLQDDWDLISRMIKLAHKELSVPITAKIRIFNDRKKTVDYAKMLVDSGCQLLTVHGRTREMKGPVTGVADWSVIKEVKEAVSVPVFSNGNLQYHGDIKRCLDETGVDGVMSAEGNLYNPALFEDRDPPASWEMSEEYLAIVEKYPCSLSFIRGHLFKLWHKSLEVHSELRIQMARAKSIPALADICRDLKERGMRDKQLMEESAEKQQVPYWICQPYVRPSPEVTAQRKLEESRKRPLLSEIGGDLYDPTLSRKQMKRLVRQPNKNFKEKGMKFKPCVDCGNPKGLRCIFDLCKACCKGKAHKAMVDCVGHNLLFKTKMEKRLIWEAKQKLLNEQKEDSKETNNETQQNHDNNSKKEEVTGLETQLNTETLKK
ncbi:tRNA-dihydrouridine(16/17) synthase [NAD(P)(+)]-like [Anneissia japonica]|uniref:tRNA-dihydrouridine(16/17) synthase [NAD(P)(+)]-like n=1 Tax=Anneissia japonica TaxID=1529436 RepID=UPI0014258E52|nr:tRNA-dihydrouridine(16/17) synthase [NAD(P)(+)]-like [Anneissia japonica]